MRHIWKIPKLIHFINESHESLIFRTPTFLRSSKVIGVGSILNYSAKFPAFIVPGNKGKEDFFPVIRVQ